MKYEMNNIYNEDCINGLKNMVSNNQKVDCILTSPPYNIIRPNSIDRGYDLYKDGMSNDEYIKWTIDIFKLLDSVLNSNGKILYNMSYGAENTILMNLVVAEIIKQTNKWQCNYIVIANTK